MPRVEGALQRPGQLFAVWLIGLLCALCIGCSGSSAAAPQADAQDRLSKLFNLYRTYAEKNQKGPPNEQALREFGQKLSPAERSDRLIGEDLEGIFTSPRDNKKFVVRYNLRPEPSQNKAVAWEEDGEKGMRMVALSIGYIVEYDEVTLAPYKK